MKAKDNMEAAKAALAEKRAENRAAAETTGLVVQSGMNGMQICQQSAAIDKLGETLAMSGFFGAVSKSTATAALVNCFMEGLSPMEYKAKYHTMENGTTAVKSDYIQREFHRLGGEWKFNEWTPEVCDITFSYHGQELRGRVTLDEFKANGVAIGSGGKLKTNWSKFPREMLKARCMATYIRALCPEALGGMYTQEEVMDFAPTAPKQPKPLQNATVSPSPIAAPAKPEVVVPEVVDPPAPMPSPQIDPEVCPCGKSKGKRFEELPTATLETILENAARFPAITAEHKNAIVAVLGEREAAS